MDTVGLEVCWETAMVASSFVVPGVVCIVVVHVNVSPVSLFTLFGGMIINFAVWAFVLLVSISSSTYLFTTTSTIGKILAMGVKSRSGGCIFDFIS